MKLWSSIIITLSFILCISAESILDNKHLNVMKFKSEPISCSFQIPYQINMRTNLENLCLYIGDFMWVKADKSILSTSSVKGYDLVLSIQPKFILDTNQWRPSLGSTNHISYDISIDHKIVCSNETMIINDVYENEKIIVGCGTSPVSCTLKWNIPRQLSEVFQKLALSVMLY